MIVFVAQFVLIASSEYSSTNNFRLINGDVVSGQAVEEAGRIFGIPTTGAVLEGLVLPLHGPLIYQVHVFLLP